MRVQEISAMIDITKVPQAPTYIEGILNLRGRLVSVINFRKKFGFEAKKQDEDTRIIIVEHRGFPIGIMVDSVEEVIRIPDENVQKLARGDRHGTVGRIPDRRGDAGHPAHHPARRGTAAEQDRPARGRRSPQGGWQPAWCPVEGPTAGARFKKRDRAPKEGR